MENSQPPPQRQGQERHPDKLYILLQEIDLYIEQQQVLSQQIKEIAQEQRPEQRQLQLHREWQMRIIEGKRIIQNIIQISDNHMSEGYKISAMMQKACEAVRSGQAS